MTNQKNATNKVFGIGLGHTGTRSLDKALNILGIKSIHSHIRYVVSLRKSKNKLF